MIVITIIINYY